MAASQRQVIATTLYYALAIALTLATFPSSVSGKTHSYWAKCAKDFKDDLAAGRNNASQYLYNGHPRGLLPHGVPPLLVTLKGCERYCGTSPIYYQKDKVTDTITTWVLPIAGGLILQAPFESNQLSATILTICRWLGNPIGSLTSTLWNIKVTGRCALFLDMSVLRGQLPGYTHRNHILSRIWKRIRKCFLERTSLEPPNCWPQDLELAANPVVANADSNVAAFAELRDSLYILSVINQYSFDHTRTDKLKGFLVDALLSRDNHLGGWRRELAKTIRRERKHGVVQVMLALFWFFIALGISIDKAFGKLGENATAHDLAYGVLMGWLPMLISCTLIDRNPTNSYHTKELLQGFLTCASGIFPPLDQNNRPVSVDGLVLNFCGQARTKWHFGIANSVLSDIEHMLGVNQPLTRRNRDLITFYRKGELAVRVEETLWRFDLAEIWYMSFAVFIVAASSMGAFLISYNTPTVGLGCRSGGYMIFAGTAAFIFLVEMAGWLLYSHGNPRDNAASFTLAFLRGFITLIEVINTCWLVYITLAQTFGIYDRCNCRSSVWGGSGGYLTLDQTNVDWVSNYRVKQFWLYGTLLGVIPSVGGIIYVVYTWCTLSFLWTEDYDKAMRGLRRVRAWKFFFHFDTIDILYKLVGKQYNGILWTRR